MLKFLIFDISIVRTADHSPRGREEKAKPVPVQSAVRIQFLLREGATDPASEPVSILGSLGLLLWAFSESIAVGGNR
jgi:hypothetical protein